MKYKYIAKMLMLAFCLAALNSCQTFDNVLNYYPEPDYYASSSREIVEHRNRHFVEYHVGDVYVSNKTLYWVDGMTGKVVDNAYWLGKVIKVIPVGTKFSITAVKASFTSTSTGVTPHFAVDGISEKNVPVIPFVDIKRIKPESSVSYLYNKEFFRKLGSLE